MTIDYLRANGMIIMEGIVGSQAYGTSTPESDIDIKGVYIQPIDSILGFGYVDQVNDKSNDTTYYEVRRFLELLATNNPNILELLNLPEDKILFQHDLFRKILAHKDEFISKACKNAFAGYAIAQIKQARGLNKKIVNPIPKEKQSPLDFCYVIGGNDTENGTYPLTTWLEDNNTDPTFRLSQRACGLVNVPNARDVYALYYKQGFKNYRGIIKERIDGELLSNEIRVSSVEKGEKPLIFITYNKDGYTKYCKDYKNYWNWVENRNESRYNDSAQHGKGYDGKNMMHCYRLLSMSKEVAEGKGINVARPDREKLLAIRHGEYDYDTLVTEAEAMIKQIDILFDASDLPNQIDKKKVDDLLVTLRWSFDDCNENTGYTSASVDKILAV
jgi:predicted nucleotidyltransferase